MLKKKKEDIKRNLTDLISEALSSSSGGKQMRSIININITLNTEIGTVLDPKIGNNNANIVIKKEESDKIGLQKIMLEDRALSPFAPVKSEPMDENKSSVRTEIELDGQWPHVDVDLIPQSVKDDEVIILHSDIPVQTSPPDEPKTDLKDLPKVRSDVDLNSLQDILSRMKEARHYGDNATGIFRQIPKTESSGTAQKEGSKVVGNLQILPFQSAGHSMLSPSCANVTQSAAIGPFGGSLNFPSVSMNPFGNISESSLTKRRLFGHSSKIATTASPNISPIIAPSCLSLSKLPEVWRSTPPASVSNVELETIQKTISRTLKISHETDGKQYTSMQVSVDSQQAAKRKPSFVKKVAKAVKTKSQKLHKKLRSAVVRPQTTQKQYRSGTVNLNTVNSKFL